MATENNAAAKPESELIDKLSRGRDRDDRLAASVVDAYYPVLVRYAHTAGLPDSEVEDLIQEAFVDAYRYLQHHSAARTFRAALLNTFRRRVAERLNRDIANVPLDDVSAVLESPSLGVVDVATLRQAFEKVLSEDESRMLLLRYAEGQSLDDIARALGVSSQTIHRRIGSAIEKLQEFLTERAASRK